MGELLQPLAVVAVADEEEQRVHPLLAQAAQRRRQVVRLLHRGHPSEPGHDERLRSDAVPAPHFRGVAVERDAALELEPRRITENSAAGATPSATSSSRTSGLTATSRSVARASTVSIARKTRSPAAEVPAEDMAVEGVDDDGASRPTASRAAVRRPPAFAVCVRRASGRTARMMRAGGSLR